MNISIRKHHVKWIASSIVYFSLLTPSGLSAQPDSTRGVGNPIFVNQVSHPCSFLGIYGEDAVSRPIGEDDEGGEVRMGAVILRVVEGTGADLAGLMESDLIVRFDDQDVTGMSMLRDMVLATPSGTDVSLTVIRDGYEREISATIGQRNSALPCEWVQPRLINPLLLHGRTDSLRNKWSEKSDASLFGLRGKLETELRIFDSCRLSRPLSEVNDTLFSRLFRRFELTDRGRFGLSVQSIPDQLREYFQVPTGEKGVLVTEVHSGTAGELAGIRAGDIIIELNGSKVASPTDLLRAGAGERDSDLMMIVRNGSVLRLEVDRSPETDRPESLR